MGGYLFVCFLFLLIRPFISLDLCDSGHEIMARESLGAEHNVRGNWVCG